MSDTMLLGVLRMPIHHNDDITLIQFIDRARAAADRIERDAELIEDLQRQNQLQKAQIRNMAAMLERAEARERDLAEKILAIPYGDLHANNGDLRQDAKYRSGWNDCRARLRSLIEELSNEDAQA